MNDPEQLFHNGSAVGLSYTTGDYALSGGEAATPCNGHNAEPPPAPHSYSTGDYVLSGGEAATPCNGDAVRIANEYDINLFQSESYSKIMHSIKNEGIYEIP